MQSSMAVTAMEFSMPDLPSFSSINELQGASGARGTRGRWLYVDAFAALDSLKINVNESLLFGRSLGSGVATYLHPSVPPFFSFSLG